MSNQIQILKDFRTQLINFFDELISQFPAEPDLVMLRIFFNDQIPIKEVMEVLIQKINKPVDGGQTVRIMIKDRNEACIIENNSLFQELSKSKVNHFKKLWMSDALDNDDKQVIWSWLDSFVALSDKFSK